MYIARAHRLTHTSNHNLILPNWQHSLYLARNLHSSYTQKLASTPHFQPQNTQKLTHNTRLNIYLVANEKSLRLLDHDYVTHTLHETLSRLLGRDTHPITLNLNLNDPTHLDNSQTYKDPYPSIPSMPYTNDPPYIHPYHAAWNPTDFIYTYGSPVTSSPTLAASIVNPRTHTTTHIKIKSQPERHTINRTELAAITIALEANKLDHTLSMLTDSAFNINTIRKYAIDPVNFIHNPHTHLLKLVENIIHTRDNMRYKTRIGKVKSHAAVTHNDEGDTTARNVIEGHKTPNIIFTDADPPVGRLRTWPQTRKTSTDIPPNITKLAGLHSSLRKLIRTHTSNTTTSHGTIYNQILHKARTTGADHTIHAYSISPFRAIRDSKGVGMGSNHPQMQKETHPIPQMHQVPIPAYKHTRPWRLQIHHQAQN